MYKIWAKLYLNPEKHDAKELVRAFFGKMDFNSKNSLVIRGEEAKVEIVFDAVPPMDIIEAMSNCKIMELNFGKMLGEYDCKPKPAEDKEEEEPHAEAEPANEEKEEESQPEAEPAEVEEVEESQPEAELAEVEEIEESQPEAEPAEVEEEEEPHAEAEPAEVEEEEESHDKPKLELELKPEPKPKKRGGKRVVNLEAVDIPELKEIASKATSFKHFVKLVTEWMDMRRQREFFEELLIVTAEVDMVVWKDLENALEIKKVFFTSSDRIAVSNKVTKKFKQYNVTLMPFLATIAQFKNYSFVSEDIKMDVWPKDERKEEQTASDEIVSPTLVNVKMQCIPEIHSFDSVLSSLDKAQPIEERVKHVLTAMGWDKKNNKEKELILAIVKGAITVKEMNFDNIFEKAGIPFKENLMARMHLAKLINDFVRMYYPSHNMVNVLDFLKELQEIVVLESEIEGFAG